jgi:hypothetical protein
MTEDDLETRRDIVISTTPGPDVGQRPSSWRRLLMAARVRHLLCLAAALAPLAAGAVTSRAIGSEGVGRGSHPAAAKTVLDVPPGRDVSEPHLAVAADDPTRLFVVAQTIVPELGFGSAQELLWRTEDGGRSWTRSPLLGGSDNSTAGISGDPVVAAGRNGLVLYGTLTFDLDAAAATASEHVGTRISTDGGASFTAFGSADEAILPICFFDNSCLPPPPPSLKFLDKPWLALDATNGAFAGSAYLVWVRVDLGNGRHELVISTSRDQGRTYAHPVVLQQSSDDELAGLEELAQVAVRPDGTVDAVWNGVRRGRAVVLHAISIDGGASFSAPERVVRLRPDASRLGIVTSLAVSRRGRLGLCWSQARSPDRYDARVACTVTDKRGVWGPAREILPDNDDRQYLPAATFQGEKLWAAAYVSSATSTRLVAVHSKRHRFGDPITVNSWPIPGDRICAPHPPDCQEGQTFIGDYVGLVPTRRRVVAAYIEPSASGPQPNRVLVSSFR